MHTTFPGKSTSTVSISDPLPTAAVTSQYLEWAASVLPSQDMWGRCPARYSSILPKLRGRSSPQTPRPGRHSHPRAFRTPLATTEAHIRAHVLNLPGPHHQRALAPCPGAQSAGPALSSALRSTPQPPTSMPSVTSVPLPWLPWRHSAHTRSHEGQCRLQHLGPVTWLKCKLRRAHGTSVVTGRHWRQGTPLQGNSPPDLKSWEPT